MIKHIKHHYQVVLTIEDKDDIRDTFRITKEVVLFETHNRDKAMDFIYVHRFMETPLEPDDDGKHWLHLKTLHLRQLR